ncbi:hypothetical protein NTD86_20480 [Pseudomonas sp. 7P_10.2_Bac1]|uniref:hypothetical protein n=1 Tax=Pseudomonas sp. 7P_10.2_Bac1 TaxID=2971614 RepID=UPI0021C80799|nr:hypothetical protein [Pseudomonas sp. 7P_10.2_Bac1]MCU1729355.1 hypothetical protein [Pseudomonas sp. 7P_10.2_Bac1]
MKKILGLAALGMLVGCSANQSKETEYQETRECMTYRSMMTAPMAPDAMQRLREACEKSRS